jgi:hypothetical protein
MRRKSRFVLKDQTSFAFRERGFLSFAETLGFLFLASRCELTGPFQTAAKLV